MVYIRSKRVKGIDYAYIVKSEWDAQSKTSRQQTVKYLGKAADVELEDIPLQYRQDVKILAFLSQHRPKDLKKRKSLLERIRKNVYLALCSGDVENCITLYEESRHVLTLEDFYDKILKPVMEDIGSKWERGQLEVATEHVCTNTAYAMVATIDDRIVGAQTRGKVLLCSPEGELHGFASAVLASVLKSKGYRVRNAAPSVPSDQLVLYVEDFEPDLIMVSITLKDNIKAGERLVGTIISRCKTPILVGGLAMVSGEGNFHGAVVIGTQDNSLGDILRCVRSSLRKSGRDV